MKKLMSVLLTAALCLGLFAGCADKQDGGLNQKLKIGVVQIVEHLSLNTIRDSFTEQLKVLGYKDGENCTIEYKSAQGDQTTLNSIIQTFAGDKKDIIVAIATQTAQAAAKVSGEIPVVFSAVSDPVGAGLVSSLEKPDKNITGTCDAVQVDKILDLALECYPNIKTLGLLYNAGEPNSVSNIAKAKAYAQSKGIKIEEATITTSAEVQQAAQVLVSKADAVFTPNDNMVASAMNVLADAANKAKIPVFVGADSMVSDGGLATIGIDYTDLGKETANMADRILKGELANNIPVKVFDTDLSTYFNQKTADTIGFAIPDAILQGEKTVIMGK